MAPDKNDLAYTDKLLITVGTSTVIWVIVTFFSLNFSIGNFIFQDYSIATVLGTISVISIGFIIKIQKVLALISNSPFIQTTKVYTSFSFI